MEQYTTAVNDALQTFTGKYELEEDIIKDLKNILLDSGKKYVKTQKASKSAVAASTANRTRRKTGYNMFVKARFAEEKAKVAAEGGQGDEKAKSNSQDAMSKYSREWKGLSPEEQQPFKDQAKEVNEASGADVAATSQSGGKKKSKSLTGYNLFYRNNKEAIKTNLKDDEKLMKVVGAQWKSLTDAERKEWNALAEAETAALAEAEVNA